MRRNRLLTMILLLTIQFLPALSVRTQQTQEGKPLPTREDFPEAGANCKRRVNLSPWVGVPGVDWPKTFQCVLKIHTCEGVKTYTSAVRPGGTGVCDDYWKVHDELVNREICCDPGSPDEKQPPEEKRLPASKCEPPTPWFDTSSGCKELKGPQLVITGDTATLYMCGYAVFNYSDTFLRDRLSANAYRRAMIDQVQSLGLNRVCCDTFRDAVRTGKPCDPRDDVDCDGQPNKSDLDEIKLPAIEIFTRPDDTRIDYFPSNFHKGDPDFLPNRTARASKGVGDCPCKWELISGELKCSPDGKQKHYYKATWRCPQTRAEVFTVKYAPATESCGKDTK
jgi:hypothetical protein